MIAIPVWADISYMPQLAIITPAHTAAIPYLPESAAGVKEALAQVPGWEAHWRIELDGVGIGSETVKELETELSQLLMGTNCRSVKVSDHGFQAGAAVTRSIAFFDKDMPECDWTLSLDADDILVPDALRVMHEAISSYPELYYVAGGIIKAAADQNLGESPTVLSTEGDPWEGLLPPGMHEVPATEWRYLKPLVPGGSMPARGILDFMEVSHRFPIFAACVCYKSQAIRELGGWPGTPTGADAALLSYVSEKYPGWVSEEPFIAYRQHAQQNTRSQWFLRNRGITWRMVAATTGRDMLPPGF